MTKELQAILFGKKSNFRIIEENALELEGVTIIDPSDAEDKEVNSEMFTLKNANEKVLVNLRQEN